MTVPGPPLRATVNPGTRRSASPSVVICRASRSARDSVLTLSASSESGVSTYDAVTVSDSSTALTARRSSSSVLETCTRVAGAAKPGAHAFTSTLAPAGRSSTTNAPEASVTTAIGAAVAPETVTRAPVTARPSGSTTRPRSVSA